MDEQRAFTPSLGGDSGESLVPVGEADRAFGRYALRYEIASGGMATVFLARAHGPAGFDRPVAIKRIHPHLAKKREFVEMFLDEARLSARISHPNVCSVFDFGEVSGTYFMAMEYLVGQPVSAILRRLLVRQDLAATPRWRAAAMRIVADACEGLHAAHELRDASGQPMNVVHRDFTPHNVFVTYDGAIKVVDFGVARAEGRLHHTETGTLKGKLAYMSPEQVKARPYDRRLDVWAAGVSLWELLTVQRLFGKKTEVELLQAVMTDPIVAPSKIRPGIPPELDAIVLGALARDPARRTPTARALSRALNQVLAASGVSTSLADMSELMEELFAADRASKLGVVASVLESASELNVGHGGLEIGGDTISGTVSRASERRKLALALETDETPPIALVRPASVRPPALPGASASRPEPPARDRLGLVVGGIAALALLAVLAIALVVFGPGAAGRDDMVTPLPPVVAAPVQAVSDTPAAPPPTLVEPTAATAVAPEVTSPEPTPSEPAPPETDGTPRTPSAASRREPAATAATRGTTGTGSLNIVARGGWADVYVDGERVGRTPRSVTLPAGRHVVELRPEGELPADRRTVTLRAGETERLIVDLADPPRDSR